MHRLLVNKWLHKTRAPRAEQVLVWLIAATLYFAFAASTIYLTSDGKTIATVWPANAVLVALLTLGSAPRWKLVLSAGLVGNLAANWITRGSTSGPLLYSLANGVEVFVAVRLIRADRCEDGLKASTKYFFRFIAVSGAAAPLAGGLIGALTAKFIYEQGFLRALSDWLFSDGLGLIIFTPVFISVFNGDIIACLGTKSVRERLETFFILAFVALVTWLVFFVAVFPALFVLYAPVMLVTFRIGPLGTKMAVMIVAVVGAYATAMGKGPLTMMTGDPVSQAHMFQIALAIIMMTCLPVATALNERSEMAKELLKREQAAQIQASTDALTGVLNRRGFEEAASSVLSDCQNAVTLVAIDVDHFKGFNDQWGHQFGDRVLQHLASVLRQNTRPGDLVGRLGGDEFALLIRTGEYKFAEALCSRIQTKLRSSSLTADETTEVLISISCGLASRKQEDRLESLHQRADEALYVAKSVGRNAIRSSLIA